jgi:hypothetical protein
VTRTLGALLVALVAGGCTSTPSTGAFERPEIYPDRTTPLSAWQTYSWAWKTGDIDVLQQVTGGFERAELDAYVKVNGREATAEWYRKGMDDALIDEARWIHHGDRLAYLRIVLRSSAYPRQEIDVAISGRGSEDWLITRRKLVR